jgi:LmbE family N-acetylglucosaminyl deacetylase
MMEQKRFSVPSSQFRVANFGGALKSSQSHISDLQLGIGNRTSCIMTADCATLQYMTRILGITAHPDDEVGAFGGTLLLYHARGVETFVICLTQGQAATNRGNARSNEELAALRRAEFFASCKVLQVTQAQILDYHDGALNRTDFYSVAGDLTRRVREIKPDIILTMGPEGAITGHPDHSMASIFATGLREKAVFRNN